MKNLSHALAFFVFMFVLLCFQVGLYDGTVAIYNVRTIRDDPILDSL